MRLELPPGVDQQHHAHQPDGLDQAVLGPGVETHCKYHSVSQNQQTCPAPPRTNSVQSLSLTDSLKTKASLLRSSSWNPMAYRSGGSESTENSCCEEMNYAISSPQCPHSSPTCQPFLQMSVWSLAAHVVSSNEQLECLDVGEKFLLLTRSSFITSLCYLSSKTLNSLNPENTGGHFQIA